MKKFNQFFARGKAFAPIFLRLVIGWRLIAGVWPYATGSKSINEVKDHFATLHLPLPMLSANLSVYAQLIGAILLILGLWTRPAALILVINFCVAIIASDIHHPIFESFSAWVILAASLFFLMNGAGKPSMDDYLSGRKVGKVIG